MLLAVRPRLRSLLRAVPFLAGLLLAALVASLTTAGGAAAAGTTIQGVTLDAPGISVVSARSLDRKSTAPSGTNLTVEASYRLSTASRLRIAETVVSVRPADGAGAGFDFGYLRDVEVSGSKRFRVSGPVSPGRWKAFVAFSVDGVTWVSGPSTAFEVAGSAPAPVTEPAPLPVTQPAPAPDQPAAPAPLSPPDKLGSFESGDFAGWDLGGASIQPNPGAAVVVDRTRAYDGTASARASLPGGPDNQFARTLWGNSSGQSGALNFGEGKDVWYGMALYLPPGFNSSMKSYFVPMRWDNYGVPNVSRSGLAMYGDGTWRLFRERAGVEQQVNLLGGTTFRLDEGRWYWLEVHQRLSSTDGVAVNELFIDDVLVGASTSRNYYGEPVSAIRYGAVAISAGAQTTPLTLWYDRATVSSSRVGARR